MNFSSYILEIALLEKEALFREELVTWGVGRQTQDIENKGL